MSQFYLQNASRRSAQSFPIDLPDGIRFIDAKAEFAGMLGVPPEQIVRLTTADGLVVLPGQAVPGGALILEVERRTFDHLTGSGSFEKPPFLSTASLYNILLPSLVVFCLFAGYCIILGGISSASAQCKNDEKAAIAFQTLFTWPPNPNGVNNQFTCGLSLSLFWWIITADLILVILPAIVLLLWADSFNNDIKGSWAYIMTCTINITTALLCLEAWVVVPGAYYANRTDDMPQKFSAAVETMAAGVIVLLVAHFTWILCQSRGKMIPETFQCCGFCAVLMSPGKRAEPTATVSLEGY